MNLTEASKKLLIKMGDVWRDYREDNIWTDEVVETKVARGNFTDLKKKGLAGGNDNVCNLTEKGWKLYDELKK